MIPKLQDLDSAAFEHPGPMSVIGSLRLCRMPSAIDFDCELGLGAVEIENEITDDMLAPKFVSGKLSVSEAFPENVFCLGRALSQGPGVEGEEAISHERNRP